VKLLVLGKGVANDGVTMLLDKNQIEYDYLNPDEVKDCNYSFVVKAPGIPLEHELLQEFQEKKIRILTDIELAMKLRKKFYIGVTGSNGKTTTVSLINKILSAKYKTVACGNIGYSVCKALVEHEDAEIFVVELSSFQLEAAKIDLNISLILNVHPCHLDHHSSFRKYAEAKANIFLNQSPNHYVVYNYTDPIVKELVSKSLARKITFSNESVLARCYTDRGVIYYQGKRVLKINENLRLKEFLLTDILAATSVCMLVDKITPKLVARQLKEFKEIEYRLTKINDFIYNDAKSTNPYSTIAAIKCFSEVELVCGGYDRKENLNCLTEYLPKIKRVYAYGQTKDKIHNFMQKNNVECITFDSLDAAFQKAYEDRKEEVILFSPMFASFDGFKNYNERGKYFAELAKNFLEE